MKKANITYIKILGYFGDNIHDSFEVQGMTIADALRKIARLEELS